MDNKDRLMDEALRLYARRGVDAVGVQEIVDAAAVTKPTLYHHFGSKEGLTLSIVNRGWTRLQASLATLGPYDNDLPWYLERQAALWIGVVEQQPEWFRLQLSLTFLPDDNPAAALVRPGAERLFQDFQALFVLAAQQHGNMRGRQALLASGWMGTLNHWTGLALVGAKLPDGPTLHAGTRQFLYGIFS